MAHSRLIGAGVLAALALAATPALAARGPKPTVGELHAAPAYVYGGRATHLEAPVTGAVTCTLSSNKAIAGLPVTLPCAGTTFAATVTMPANATSKPVYYKLKLKVAGLHGSASASAKVTLAVGAPPPVVVTNLAGPIGSVAATLHGTVNPEGSAVTRCTFEYGDYNGVPGDNYYAYTVPCEQSPGSGEEATPVSATVLALAPVTVYHARLTATNANGTAVAPEVTFETTP